MTQRFGQVDCPSSWVARRGQSGRIIRALCGRGGDHPDVECSSGAPLRLHRKVNLASHYGQEICRIYRSLPVSYIHDDQSYNIIGQ